MKRILVAVDMQNDFIDGSLGTKEAVAIVPRVAEKIRSYDRGDVFATQDTHPENYLGTQEGRNLPVRHCIKGTEGWRIRKEIADLVPPEHVFQKPTFGSTELAGYLLGISEKEEISIELVGLCTDICVVSNALMLKAFMPEVPISVDPSCCAGVTPEKHAAAIETMRSCQIGIE